ncbi:MAG: molybdopterin-dependent oxidoreductase [Thermomicrobiales bacterium]
MPPGQIVSPRWPVLHQGQIPLFDPASWDFRVWGLVETPATWRWDAFQNLPVSDVSGDLHCVTRWSTLEHDWHGVRPCAILERTGVLPAARYVLLHGEGGYTANLPIDVLLADDVVLATHHGGEPLTPEHGAPLRAVAPGRYAWKSVKWLRGIEVLADDRPGFWEEFGYSNSADPWREERFES